MEAYVILLVLVILISGALFVILNNSKRNAGFGNRKHVRFNAFVEKFNYIKSPKFTSDTMTASQTEHVAYDYTPHVSEYLTATSLYTPHLSDSDLGTMLLENI